MDGGQESGYEAFREEDVFGGEVGKNLCSESHCIVRTSSDLPSALIERGSLIYIARKLDRRCS